ncbi:piRNA biogenesis protein EXD1 [Nephila pilipes]|uniref:PiRNA biogenesis protein EXD1 n=1 Tax=Nephila pilipes TaxID=299642 RepID=A0A8X6SYG1_NEPPI|nr:piRNA biogenesis protein EXD1 [Nephila pilipes]
MTSMKECVDLLHCTIRFTVSDGKYEGMLVRVNPKAQMISVGKTILLPCGTKFGTLHFHIYEITSLEVIKRPDLPKEKDEPKQKDPAPANQSYMAKMYDLYGSSTRTSAVRTFMDDMFDLDGDSDIENEDAPDLGFDEGQYSVKLPPMISNHLPLDSVTLDSINNDFHLAVEHIETQDSIGVSLEGLKISRSGTLVWLCISTSFCTFLFDILKLGETAFQNGLKSILENSRIQKIFHDCRFASDCLYHVYKIRLVNVFDTQGADSIAMMQQNKDCKVIRQVNTLNACLSYYLEVPDEYLYEPLCFDEDERSLNYYGRRPLLHKFQDVMIKNVMYLRMMKNEVQKALLIPLQKVTNVYLDTVQSLSDREVLVCPLDLTELPREVPREGVQIVRYKKYENIPPVVSSGLPCRKVLNPVKDYLEHCSELEMKKLPSESVLNKNNPLVLSGSPSCIEMSQAHSSGDGLHSDGKMRDPSKTKETRSFETELSDHFAKLDIHNTSNSEELQQKNVEEKSSISLSSRIQFSSKDCQKNVLDPIKVSHHVDVKVSNSVKETEPVSEELLARICKENISSDSDQLDIQDGSNCKKTQVFKLPCSKENGLPGEKLQYFEVVMPSREMGSVVDSSNVWEALRKDWMDNALRDNSNKNKSKLKFVPAGMPIH